MGQHSNVLAPGEVVWAAGMTLGFNLSDDVACVMEVAAAMALVWLLTGNGSHGGSHEHHLLSKDFIPGPVLSSGDTERLSNQSKATQLVRGHDQTQVYPALRSQSILQAEWEFWAGRYPCLGHAYSTQRHSQTPSWAPKLLALQPSSPAPSSPR